MDRATPGDITVDRATTGDINADSVTLNSVNLQVPTTPPCVPLKKARYANMNGIADLHSPLHYWSVTAITTIYNLTNTTWRM